MQNSRRHFIIWPLLIGALVLAFQWFSATKIKNPETGETHRGALDEKQEASMGLQSFQQVLSDAKPVTSGPAYEQVQRVMKKLIPGTGQDFQWQVAVVESDQVNAFCLPGGKMVVYTGILPVAQTDAGLATVLGHEMAHATSHHGSQRLLQQKMVSTAMLAGQVSMSQMDQGDQRMVLGALGAGAMYGVINPYSRTHESEADRIGLHYMARAGYDPHDAIAFWERMQSQGGSKPPEFLSDHPSDANRIAALKAEIPEAMKDYEKSGAAAPASQ